MTYEEGRPGADDAEVVTVELDQYEAATGAVKSIVVAGGAAGLNVRIPPGLTDNTILRLSAVGPPAVPGGPPADLLIIIRIRAAAGAPPLATTPFGVGAPPVPPVKPTGSGAKVIATALALGLAGLCCFGSWQLFKPSDDPAVDGLPRATGGSSAAAPAPSLSPVSAQEYQQLLTAADTNLAAGLRKIAAARTPTAVGAAATGLESSLSTLIGQLKAITPPAAAGTAHQTLLRGLIALGTEVRGEITRASTGRTVCVGSSALSLLSRSPAAVDLRAAGKELATADPAQAYKFGSFVPAKANDANRRLANGTMIKSISSRGSGQLKINNSSVDAAISLVPVSGGKPVLTVYVTASKNYTVRGIRSGTYKIFMTSGNDWDKTAKAFTRNCGFQKFDDSFAFTASSGRYTVWTITLTKAVGGNASTSGVDPGDFPAG